MRPPDIFQNLRQNILSRPDEHKQHTWARSQKRSAFEQGAVDNSYSTFKGSYEERIQVGLPQRTGTKRGNWEKAPVKEMVERDELTDFDSDIYFTTGADEDWWVNYDGDGVCAADSYVAANRLALMMAPLVGGPGSTNEENLGDVDLSWLAGTAMCPEAMHVDVFFTEGKEHGASTHGMVNADLDMADDYDRSSFSSSSLAIHLADDAGSSNRSELMGRPTLHVTPDLPYPTWEESSLNSDICFHHWPDWAALCARTRDDAAVAAALLSEAAAWGVIGGGGVTGVVDGEEHYAVRPSSPAILPRVPSTGHGMEVM